MCFETPCSSARGKGAGAGTNAGGGFPVARPGSSTARHEEGLPMLEPSSTPLKTTPVFRTPPNQTPIYASGAGKSFLTPGK